jgi:hypothetical protein
MSVGVISPWADVLHDEQLAGAGGSPDAEVSASEFRLSAPEPNEWIPMSDRLDRRISPRWIAVPNEITLELQTRTGSRRAKARLVNISREGALLLTDEVPPAGVLWMRMESPARTDWIAAVPIRHDPSRQVAVRFHRPCEDDVLLAAMLGLDFGPTLLDGGLPRSFDDAPAVMPA